MNENNVVARLIKVQQQALAIVAIAASAVTSYLDNPSKFTAADDAELRLVESLLDVVEKRGNR